jgi:SAM-dependent methyltransferase
MQPEPLIETDGIFASQRLLDVERKSQSDHFVKLLRSAQLDGWLPALKKHSPDLLNYISNPSRLALLPHLPIKSSSRLLEIGPGYGQMTAALAKQAMSVTAIDADIGQARFCRIRLDQEGCSNATIIAGGETGFLPIKDEAFDGVVMNLVLEWCATRADLNDHDTVQRRYLSEIYRTLAPGGFFFVSTKNRYSVRLLLGGRDEHLNGVRFGSCLPRAIGNSLIERRAQAGRLHSYPRLHQMLETAGFKDIKPLLAMPDARWPRAYLPPSEGLSGALAADAIKDLPAKQKFVLALVPTSFVKYIMPGLTFLVSKP